MSIVSVGLVLIGSVTIVAVCDDNKLPVVVYDVVKP